MAGLYHAHDQWCKRPADERFESLGDMFAACKGYADSAAQAVVSMGDVSIVSPDDRELQIVGGTGTEARLTHWSFGQLCGRAGAPAGYLRQLPAKLSADCLNTGLKASALSDDRCNVLFHKNGSLVCRAFTSDDYSRIWNWQLVERLQTAEESGWQVPCARPAMANQPGTRKATEADVLTLSAHPTLGVKVGDDIAPAGLYASDHDMFAFMVNEQARIEDGSEGGLSRGFFVQNSEVGASSLKITKFLYRHVCGNHIIWDAKDVKEIRIVHRGHNDQRYGRQLRNELRTYSEESATKDQERVNSAKRMMLGDNRQDVIDRLFVDKLLPKKTAEAAYDFAVQEADSRSTGTSPRSVWGVVQGVTRMSQNEQHADNRVELDKAAGKILSIAF